MLQYQQDYFSKKDSIPLRLISSIAKVSSPSLIIKMQRLCAAFLLSEVINHSALRIFHRVREFHFLYFAWFKIQAPGQHSIIRVQFCII